MRPGPLFEQFPEEIIRCRTRASQCSDLRFLDISRTGAIALPSTRGATATPKHQQLQGQRRVGRADPLRAPPTLNMIRHRNK